MTDEDEDKLECHDAVDPTAVCSNYFGGRKQNVCGYKPRFYKISSGLRKLVTAVQTKSISPLIFGLNPHRWLAYLCLLLFDVLICLLVLFGLIRNSKGTLIG